MYLNAHTAHILGTYETCFCRIPEEFQLCNNLEGLKVLCPAMCIGLGSHHDYKMGDHFLVREKSGNFTPNTVKIGKILHALYTCEKKIDKYRYLDHIGSV